MKSNLKLESSGRFSIENASNLSYTYFPLCNFNSLKSSITPSLHGSCNLDQNTFLLEPVTNEDLHSSLRHRHLYLKTDDYLWSTSGYTAYQLNHPDSVTVSGDILHHTVTRTQKDFICTIESISPEREVNQELHRFTIKNTSKQSLKLQATVAVPIYGRSADSVRDHRHVTALLNKATIVENGIINKPTFSFDERGHNINQMCYGIFARHTDNATVKNYWPVVEEFIGEGGSFLQPRSLVDNQDSSFKPGDIAEGYSLLGGLEFETITLQPNQSTSFIVSLMIDTSLKKMIEEKDVMNESYFAKEVESVTSKWNNELDRLQFNTPDNAFNGWLRWVTIQPTLRRLYGNSFLPHHDYGRGGKGWRDLWQDQLALLLLHPDHVQEALLNNFKGVRIDGSNATIIGDNLGEFLADRNHIARVWMDHGAWPLQTVKLYIDKTGDLDLLLKRVEYFQDQFTHYTKQITSEFNKNNQLQTNDKSIYKGTILEHIIIQNLVPYFNVGEHGNIRLEDADWNDGLDMAPDKGESVTFTAFYGGNLIDLSRVLLHLHEQGEASVTLVEEVLTLLEPLNKKTPTTKQERLTKYFNQVAGKVSGKTVTYNTVELAKQCKKRGEELLEQVRNQEWLKGKEHSFFNGYYDNDSNRLENPDKKHMTLTGQVFPIAYNAATREQVMDIVSSSDALLFDQSVGGYRLNTNFNEIKTNMGRLFGFAYGHKENGAMFSHMAVMYAHALYKRGFVKEGHRVLTTIFEHSIDLSTAKMYPGIPEYFDQKGRGMYPYLTGSASWYILTMVTEVYGIKGEFGDVVLEPKLTRAQFDSDGKTSITTIISGTPRTITYINEDLLEYGTYRIATVKMNKDIEFERTMFGVRLSDPVVDDIVITLTKK